MDSIDQILLTGTPEEINEVMECENALVVDWRSEEEEVLSDTQDLVDGLEYEMEELELDDACQVRMSYKGRRAENLYHYEQQQNCFRVVIAVAELLSPDQEIRIFTPTADSDTHVFLIRPSAFWRKFDQEVDESKRGLFADIGSLSDNWGLSEES